LAAKRARVITDWGIRKRAHPKLRVSEQQGRKRGGEEGKGKNITTSTDTPLDKSWESYPDPLYKNEGKENWGLAVGKRRGGEDVMVGPYDPPS